MSPLDTEAVHEALELLVETLHLKSAAAARRQAQLRLGSRHQLALVERVEAAASSVRAGVVADVPRGERVARLVALATAAAEFDAEYPDGGALLSSEHGQARQMTGALVAHLHGEFSFRFLAGGAAAGFYEEAAVVLDTICSLHFADWQKLVKSEAA